MLLLLNIAGGVALILFGVRYLRKGLDRLFGPRLGRMIERMANTRWRAFLSGLCVSVIAPSSTTVSILAVQAVQAGHLSTQRMLAVMLGANVGLTVMVLLIALRLEQLAPVLILVGVILFQFTQRNLARGIGQIVLSLGFIFMAIEIIKTATSGFDPSGDLIELLRILQDHPLGLTLIAAVLSMGLQSSTAAIGLVLGLGLGDAALEGAVGLRLALPVVIGANVGIALNTLAVGWRQVDSRRLAAGNLLAKLLIGVAVLAMMPLAVDLLERLPTGVDKQIALAHSAFNVILAVVFLPCVSPLDRLLQRIIPPPPAQAAFGPRYIRREPIDGFTLAIGQSMREILHVSEITRYMLRDCWQALITQDIDLARRVQERDDQVDLLDAEIKRFLVELAGKEGDQDASGQIMRQLRYLDELEAVGDVIDKNLAELAIKRARSRVEFSPEGWEDLNDFYRKVYENMEIAETAFATRDPALARKLLRHKERLSEYERELRDRHFNRLKSGLPQTYESSAIHLDILTHLKRINSSVSHVAYAILQNGAASG